MATRNAARVLPEPVGAEMRVVSPRRIAGQPSIWGSVAEPNLVRNHSATTGCAHARAAAASICASGASAVGAGTMGYCTAGCSLFVCSQFEPRR